MHRNIANLCRPIRPRRVKVVADAHGTSAALEYGVRALKVPHVLVLGHTQCGGVQGCHDMCAAGQSGPEFALPLVGAGLRRCACL